MTTIRELGLRACPWEDCQCVWIPDPRMYIDTDICPECGRSADTYELPDYSDRWDWIGGGTGKRRQIIYTETGGPLFREDGLEPLWIVTEHSV